MVLFYAEGNTANDFSLRGPGLLHPLCGLQQELPRDLGLGFFFFFLTVSLCSLNFS